MGVRRLQIVPQEDEQLRKAVVLQVNVLLMENALQVSALLMENALLMVGGHRRVGALLRGMVKK